MDWVERPKNYKGLYGILQLLQGSHLALLFLVISVISVNVDNVIFCKYLLIMLYFVNGA